MGEGTAAGGGLLVSQRATESIVVVCCTSLEVNCRWWTSQRDTDILHCRFSSVNSDWIRGCQSFLSDELKSPFPDTTSCLKCFFELRKQDFICHCLIKSLAIRYLHTTEGLKVNVSIIHSLLLANEFEFFLMKLSNCLFIYLPI